MRSTAALALLSVAAQASVTPGYHGCLSSVAKALPYCDSTLPLDARLDDLQQKQ